MTLSLWESEPRGHSQSTPAATPGHLARCAGILLAGLLVVAASVTALYASDQLPDGHDVWVHAVNAFEFARCIEAGTSWPRWLPDLCGGYGSPNPLYYNPLPHQLTGRLLLAGLPLVEALRAAATFAMAVSFAGMFWWGRMVWGRAGGFLAGTLYLCAPYHLFDLYGRFAYPELLGLALAPWLFGAVHASALTGRNARAVPVLLALLALTHNVSAFLFSGLLALFLGCLALEPSLRGNCRKILWVLPAAPGLAAFFWMPALFDAHLVRLPRDESIRVEWTRHLNAPARLFEGPGTVSATNPPIFPGQLQLALGAAATVAAALLALRGHAGARATLACSVVTAGTLGLTLAPSGVVWASTPLSVVQFPWRLLGPAALLLAWLAPLALWPLWQRRGLRDACCYALAMLALVQGCTLYLRPERKRVAVDGRALRASYDTGDLSSHFVPAAALQPMLNDQEVFAIAAGSGTLRVDQAGAQLHRVVVRADGEVVLDFRNHYHPGWRATVDACPALLELEDSAGGMRLRVPAGIHTVELKFGSTTLGAHATAVSAATLALMLAGAAGAGRAVRGVAWLALSVASGAVAVPVAQRTLPWGSDYHAHRARVALSYRDHHRALAELVHVEPGGPHGAWAREQLEEHRGHGLIGRYFADASWQVPRLERKEFSLCYVWSALPGQPAETVPVSAILSGTLDVPRDGAYAFSVEAYDRGGLLLDGRWVVPEPPLGSPYYAEGSAELKSGPHALAFVYRNTGEQAVFRVRWRPPGGAWEIIPLSSLRPARHDWVEGVLAPPRASGTVR